MKTTAESMKLTIREREEIYAASSPLRYRTPFGEFLTWGEAVGACQERDMDHECVETVRVGK